MKLVNISGNRVVATEKGYLQLVYWMKFMSSLSKTASKTVGNFVKKKNGTELVHFSKRTEREPGVQKNRPIA